MANNYDLIKSAIINKQHICATYNGYYREMCPHALGKKGIIEQALFYQFGGESSSGTIVPGSPNNWRCIPVNGLENVIVKSGSWYTANNHSTPSKCIDIIDVEVAY